MGKSPDNSLIAFLLSLVTLILYYMFLKPVLTIEVLNSTESFAKHSKKKYIMMLVLFSILSVVHFIVNLWGFQSKCGGTITENLGKVFVSTFAPWFIIFGLMMAVLIIFPGFKGTFSNVIGYYAVARSSNKILVQLMGNPEVDKELSNNSDSTSDENVSSDKSNIRKASDAILKLVGNTSILINQLTPENFMQMWGMLIPVMKTENQDSAVNAPFKKQLLEDVVLRDNIGEFCWYLYTTILLMIMTKTMMLQQECVTTVAHVKENTDKYNKQEDEKKKREKENDKVVYKG